MVVMDSEDGCNFDFAFNNSNFSDRLLCIHIESPQSTLVRIETLYICSAILAARSPFFYKLFTNGMIESKQCHATLQINASEEAAFMELLKFMYSNTLRVTRANAILDVLIAADKFDVASCLRHCSRLLKKLLTTTPEYLSVYLNLPSNILMAEALQPLTVAAKQLCVKFEDEILSLPLVGVEAIIASDDIQVTSEYVVFLFVLKWVRFNYPKIEERREIMARLAKFIRYPFMTYKELRDISNYIELKPSFALFVRKEAVAFKGNALDPNYIKNDDFRRFLERTSYKRQVETPLETAMVECLTWAILSTCAVGLACAVKGLIWVMKKLW